MVRIQFFHFSVYFMPCVDIFLSEIEARNTVHCFRESWLLFSQLFHLHNTYLVFFIVSGQNLTPAEQLSLTMAWNRPDIARSKVFAKFNNWSVSFQYSF